MKHFTASLTLAIALTACSSGGPRDGGIDAQPAADASDAEAAAQYAPPYSQMPFNNTRIGSDSSMANFQKVHADIDLRDGPFARVMLVIDLATTCYPFSGWTHDPPPMGQNWPADCDAFDRNFEFTLDEPVAMTDPPAIELVRAITPFGGPEHLEIDITDVANGRPGHHTLQALITTYSDAAGLVSGSNGGWNVSAHIDAMPGPPPHNVLAVIPVFNLVQSMGTAPLSYGIDVPAGTVASRLEYRITGHGGGASRGDLECDGPAEEFCDRTHTITVDGAATDMLDAWRNDCAMNCTIAHQGSATGGFDYCMENPCGDVNSVRASRANWCPGTLTPPFNLDETALRTPGHHTFTYAIDREDAGGSWRMSAVYLAFGP